VNFLALVLVFGFGLSVALIIEVVLAFRDYQIASAAFSTSVALHGEEWLNAAGSVERAQLIARTKHPVVTNLVNAAAFQYEVERSTLLGAMQGVYGVEGFSESCLTEDVVDPDLSLVQMFELERFRHSMESALRS
jgi:hypothetical protein